MTLKNSLESSLNTRLKNVQKELKKNAKSAYLFENAHDVFYLTGLEFSRAMLIVTVSDAWLLVDGRYLQVARDKACFEVLDISEKKTFASVRETLLKGIKSLGFDGSKTSVNRFDELKKRFSNLLRKENPLGKLRQIKDAYEISALQKSADILVSSMKFAEKHLKEGVTEKEISNLLESKGLELGADRVSFRPIVAFGENAAMPHYKTGNKKLTRNTSILIDAGFMKGGYASDMTRCFFYGRVKLENQKVFDACYKAIKKVLKEVQAGVSIQHLDKLARDSIKESGFGNIPHSLGHSIGLEVHETPTLSQKAKGLKLKENMVVTIEPGIYIPEVIGIRLEEMILITKTGYKNFYKNYSI